jgi:hypothetical protein
VDWSWSFKVNASDIPTQPNQCTGIAAAMWFEKGCGEGNVL